MIETNDSIWTKIVLTVLTTLTIPYYIFMCVLSVMHYTPVEDARQDDDHFCRAPEP